MSIVCHQVPRTSSELLAELSAALYALSNTATSGTHVLDDVLIRYEEVLHTANCGLQEPAIISAEVTDIMEEVRVTKVSFFSTLHFCPKLY